MKTVEQIVEETASKTTGGLAVPLTNAVKEWMTHAVNAYIAEQEKESSWEYGWGASDNSTDVVASKREIAESTVLSNPERWKLYKRTKAVYPGSWVETTVKTGPELVREALAADGGTTPTVQGWA